MPTHRLLAASLLIALLAPSPLLRAQSEPPAAPPVPQTLAEADAQRARAEAMRQAADQRLVEEQQACYAKFLVNDCLDAAKKRRTAAQIEARELDLPAREFQREAKRAEADAKDAKRIADAPRRAAEQQQQSEDFRASEAARAAEREKKIADKAVQAAEGRQKAAAEQTERQKKLADRARRDAELADKKAREAAGQ